MHPETRDAIAAVDRATSAADLVGAVRALAARRDPEAIGPLMAALGYNNPGAAVAAVEGLVQLGEAAVQPMLDRLDGYNYTARSWALRALSQIADPRALEILLAAAETDFAPSVRRAAVKGLGFLRWERLDRPEAIAGQARALGVLEQCLGDVEWVVRYGAIVALENLAATEGTAQPALRDRALDHLQRLAETDPERALKLRSRLALERLA
ncbi:MAG: HEAT repeat domain-containing protein [Cyanophyceae cyanobacterium]